MESIATLLSAARLECRPIFVGHLRSTHRWFRYLPGELHHTTRQVLHLRELTFEGLLLTSC